MSLNHESEAHTLSTGDQLRKLQKDQRSNCNCISSNYSFLLVPSGGSRLVQVLSVLKCEQGGFLSSSVLYLLNKNESNALAEEQFSVLVRGSYTVLMRAEKYFSAMRIDRKVYIAVINL